MPLSVQTGFSGIVTPNPAAVFSPLQFAQKLDKLQPVDPKTEFTIPVGHLYGTFSYNFMVDGSQWSALWYRDGVLVYYESSPWSGGTGGYGYTDWDPKPEEWLPGNYDVQIFIGTQFKQSGQFVVAGTPIPGASATPGTPGGSTTPQPTPTGSTTPAVPSRSATVQVKPTNSPTLSPIPSMSFTPLPTGRFLITPSVTPYTITPLPTGRFLVTPSLTPTEKILP
jgi:type VI secretion system secreted protein VgrG